MSTGCELRRVTLIGFMGAGKSTVGRALASMLRWQLIDADTELVRRVGMSVAAFFAAHGELRFRALESQLIAELLGHERAVLALGGGAVEDAESLYRLRSDPHGLLVHLQVPLAVALERCARSGGSAVRPVLGERHLLEARYRARLPLYRTAHLTVSTGRGTPRAAASAIAGVVRARRAPAAGEVMRLRPPSSSRQ